MEGRADFIVAETFGEFGEAILALECIKQYGNGKEQIIKQTIFQRLLRAAWSLINSLITVLIS